MFSKRSVTRLITFAVLLDNCQSPKRSANVVSQTCDTLEEHVDIDTGICDKREEHADVMLETARHKENISTHRPVSQQKNKLI